MPGPQHMATTWSAPTRSERASKSSKSAKSIRRQQQQQWESGHFGERQPVARCWPVHRYELAANNRPMHNAARQSTPSISTLIESGRRAGGRTDASSAFDTSRLLQSTGAHVRLARFPSREKGPPEVYATRADGRLFEDCATNFVCSRGVPKPTKVELEASCLFYLFLSLVPNTFPTAKPLATSIVHWCLKR